MQLNISPIEPCPKCQAPCVAIITDSGKVVFCKTDGVIIQ